jgi:hypothetical protein
VRVLDHHQHRLARRQSLELREKRLERLLLALLRRQVEVRIAVACWGRQQVRQQRNGLTEIIGSSGQDCLQLGEPVLGRILTPEARDPFELGNAWIECAVRVVRRAEIA